MRQSLLHNGVVLYSSEISAFHAYTHLHNISRVMRKNCKVMLVTDW